MHAEKAVRRQPSVSKADATAPASPTSTIATPSAAASAVLFAMPVGVSWIALVPRKTAKPRTYTASPAAIVSTGRLHERGAGPNRRRAKNAASPIAAAIATPVAGAPLPRAHAVFGRRRR